ncbi:hypothetical protein B0J11DRAFT_211008 [Dendryphion nanum]|uniref:Uncharacterized protein n=1 Tax=Dendryphion nanum TaxID=256645 RepID=A0A9P9E6H0_9PLEO|nr:hypothetical protein B0J11DRAFT_211008 [Dendryphion nanum]
MKRERNSHDGDAHPKKRRLSSGQSVSATPTHANHPVLRRLYPELLTLRHYLLARLPNSSKNRRRRISQLGQKPPVHDTTTTAIDDHGAEFELAKLLDSILVGVSPKAVAKDREKSEDSRTKDIESFSQELVDCATGSTFKPGYFLQSEH